MIETELARLEGNGTQPERLIFANGSAIPCHGVFLAAMKCASSDLVTQLGCDLSGRGTVPTCEYEKTNVPGLYVAGDASHRV